ncbi:dihydrolipoyl dehydrogenase family protein [Motilibacter deserti]|uniref:NAD(P)/FAD-dependent oxidoreductase n=1 Tax=Motilibacter deserti TaxID=2714956 RepID=A0ABX0GQZ5_9ACTN|nr:NAD(P)/FAD-dependent oxidoreductase [Motilibacter deserti]NHC13272.1 NAD(P)/FAD-dependent oxidoreductase [Motilibacter deserti]
MEEREFDVVVIGAGPVGEVAAGRMTAGGLSVAVIEEELAGGECSYWACMPSKALLRPVELVEAAKRIQGVRGAEVDPAAVLARRDKVVKRTPDGGHDDSGQTEWVRSICAEFYRGRGRLAGERRVEVLSGGEVSQLLTAKHAVVLATGSRPTVPPIPGLREAEPWGSREVTNVDVVPDRVVILGGGVVGCESAAMLAGLGSSVTLISRGGLLDRNEPWAGELVADGLRSQGVNVRTELQVSEVSRAADGTVTVKAGDEAFVADQIVSALGRRPATAGIGLESVGLDASKAVDVDDSLRSTQLPWLYAVGDVNGRNLLTHMGKYQARACGDVLVARAKGEPDGSPKLTAYADHEKTPQVVFTDPQVASVGLTEKAARERGYDVRVVDYDIGWVAGASLVADDYTGKASMVVDEKRGVALGFTFVGQDVAELLHGATVAVTAEVPLETLWHAVASYPTVSEVYLRLLEAYGL